MQSEMSKHAEQSIKVCRAELQSMQSIVLKQNQNFRAENSQNFRACRAELHNFKFEQSESQSMQNRITKLAEFAEQSRASKFVR